jgi:hypothetical protein
MMSGADAGDDPAALTAVAGAHAVHCRRGITGELGTALPAFADHHVHLHLIDEAGLPARGIARAVDLGGDPVALARRPSDRMPHVEYAGAFLTADGGYPMGRGWAPASIVRVVVDPSLHAGVPGGASTAVDEQVAFGASIVKVALNAAAGPVLESDLLAAIVRAAHDRGLEVVAHVEGPGMTQRALDTGVDALAHTPFSELLDDAAIARAVALGQRWISTLAIHGQQDLERATANLGRFAAAGGRVIYGTDLGNGERPPGIQRAELERMDAAGIRGPALIASLTDPWPRAVADDGVSTFVPGPAPADLDAVPAWLSRAVVVPAEELVHVD